MMTKFTVSNPEGSKSGIFPSNQEDAHLYSNIYRAVRREFVPQGDKR